MQHIVTTPQQQEAHFIGAGMKPQLAEILSKIGGTETRYIYTYTLEEYGDITLEIFFGCYEKSVKFRNEYGNTLAIVKVGYYEYHSDLLAMGYTLAEELTDELTAGQITELQELINWDICDACCEEDGQQ